MNAIEEEHQRSRIDDDIRKKTDLKTISNPKPRTTTTTTNQHSYRLSRENLFFHDLQQCQENDLERFGDLLNEGMNEDLESDENPIQSDVKAKNWLVFLI